MPDAKVLVVEDEGIVAKDIRNTLDSYGYAVTDVVFTGEAAVESAAHNQPDVVLMDIVLKGDIDGITAAEQIRMRFNIPIVYVTAYADNDLLQRAKVTEPFGYILKPFDPREIHTAIEVALYKHGIEKRVRDSEELCRTLVDVAPDVIYFLLGEEGIVTSLNPAFEVITGWSQEEWLGRPFLPLVHPEDRQLAVEKFRQVLGGKAVPAHGLRFLSKSGEYLHGEVIGVPRIKEGRITGQFGFVRDVTERKRSEAEKEKLIAELKEALSSVKTLSGLLPICASCKRIRDDQGYWKKLEEYISAHSDAIFSHCLCPECARKLYPDHYRENQPNDES